MDSEKNVIKNQLETCSLSLATGFNRNGHCLSVKQDFSAHGVCCEVTEEILSITRDHGNDLSSTTEIYGSPGLQPGDRWCLCASQWQEALENDAAPPVVLSAPNESVLRHVSLDDLLKHSSDSYGNLSSQVTARRIDSKY